MISKGDWYETGDATSYSIVPEKCVIVALNQEQRLNQNYKLNVNAFVTTLYRERLQSPAINDP